MPPLVMTVKRAAVGLAGSQPPGVDLEHDLLFAGRLHIALPVGCSGDAQPLAALGDGQGALEHPLALIADHERHLPGFTRGDGSEHQPARVQVQPRPLDTGRGMLPTRLARPMSGLASAMLSSAAWAKSMRPTVEKYLTKVPFEQFSGRGPIVLASLGQFVKAAALFAGGENEFLEQLCRRSAAGLPEPQLRPVEVAELRQVRVGSLTARTKKRWHTCNFANG